MIRTKISPTAIEVRAEGPAVALPFIANGRRVVVLAVALVLVGGASFVAGSFVRAPQQSAFDAIGDHLDVTRPVEERAVSTGVELPGRVVPGATVPLLTALGGEAETSRSIVTRATLSTGQVVTPGTLLGEVSGTSLIAIPPGVPLYRDLADGSTGADVSALQSALAQLGFDVSVTGEVGSRTLAAVAELYDRAGAENPDAATIRWAELVTVDGGAMVSAAATVGTVLTEEVPLATIKVGPDVIVVRATVLEADELTAGQPVELRTADASADSAVLTVGEFTSTDEGSGRDVTVAIPEGFAVSPSEPLTVATGNETDPGPAVPTIALRQDSGGSYVELPSEDERVRMYVTVRSQSAGWSAIEPDDRLPVGTLVLVSP